MLTLGTLPWSVKFLWGPVIDRFQFPDMGRRRPWILLAQSGMIVVLASMMLIPNPEENVLTMAWMFLVYNIFTSLQDVSTDALAVDVLQPHEMEKVNSYMFTAKSVGGIIGGAGLGPRHWNAWHQGNHFASDSNPRCDHARSAVDDRTAR